MDVIKMEPLRAGKDIRCACHDFDVSAGDVEWIGIFAADLPLSDDGKIIHEQCILSVLAEDILCSLDAFEASLLINFVEAKDDSSIDWMDILNVESR
jgi:hypothetical protein